MAPDNIDLIRSVYGFDWATVAGRQQGFAAASAVIHPDLAAQVSPEVGNRTLHGLQDFAVFVQGVEEDFSEFRYDAEEFTEPAADQVFVRGTVRVRGRRSNMPLTAPFGHLWTVRDGVAVSVEAHLNPEGARRADG
jgi:ketosteroid isomerase-like protein